MVGTLGLVDRLDGPPPPVGLVAGGRILLLGLTRRRPAWAARCGRSPPTATGAAGWPALDLAAHGRLVDAGRRAWSGQRLLAGVHDVSDGGIGVALAEMSVSQRDRVPGRRHQRPTPGSSARRRPG